MTSDAAHPNPVIAQRLSRIYAMHRAQIDLRLDRSPYAVLLEKLGNPQNHLPPVIHIAGTNGKGSTLAFLRAIYEDAGYRVHCYTSPHLFRFNERIRLAGELITDAQLLAAMDEIDAIDLPDTLTFFEYTTALAFMLMAQERADICLLETGMGGRLDCTNVVPDKALTLLSTISFDHMDFLGDTIAAIAAEKAGIMQARTPCIVGPQFYRDEVLPVLQNCAAEKDVQLIIAGQDWDIQKQGAGMVFTQAGQTLPLPMPSLSGAHQIDNAGLAVMAVMQMRKQLPVTYNNIAKGLSTASWAGRLQRVERTDFAALLPDECWEIWYDGGHNDSGAAALAAQCAIWQAQGRIVHLVASLGADKDVRAFTTPFLPYIASLTWLDLPDGRKPQSAVQMQVKFAGESQIAETPQAALRALAANAVAGQHVVLFCGSLYRAASILPII